MNFEELQQKIEIQIDFIIVCDNCVVSKLNELFTKVYGLWEYGFINTTEYFRLSNLIDDELTNYRNEHLPF